MRILVISFLFLISISINAQKIKTVDNDKVCELGLSAPKIDYVDNFKDSLKLTIDLNSISVGKKSKDISFLYSEYFQNESSIVEISNKFAIRISVARAIENGNKFYLYKIHLYKKEGGCWEDYSARQNWDSGDLGVLNHGYAIGYEGASGYLGYKGKLILE